MLKRKIFFPVLALAIIGTALASSNLVSAQDNTGVNSLVSAIAQKFNLNQADVQAVFDEQRNKHHEQMKANLEQKLTQAVTDGKITETQKQAILAKLTQIQNNKQSFSANKPNFADIKNSTPEQRKAKMEQKKIEMENWAKQNGLSLDTLHQLLGGPRGFRKGMMFMH